MATVLTSWAPLGQMLPLPICVPLEARQLQLQRMLTCSAERLWQCRTNDSCALNIQPCLLNNQVITTVDLVKDLPFNALPFQQFFDGYVGCPANNLVRAQRCLQLHCL